jgi:nicotinamidase-related amidase
MAGQPGERHVRRMLNSFIPARRRGGGRALVAVCLFACAHPPPPPTAVVAQGPPQPGAGPARVAVSEGGDAAAPRTLRERYGLRAPAVLSPARTALVLVDLQREFLDGKLALPDAGPAVARAGQLLAWARRAGIHVVFVRQVAASSAAPLFAPGSPGAELAPGLEPGPGDSQITKSAAGAFSNPALHRLLTERGVEVLIVAGLMTHLAVDCTARDGTVLGYRVMIAGDATATRALPGPRGDGVVDHATLQRVALAALADRFADIATTDELIAWPVER